MSEDENRERDQVLATLRSQLDQVDSDLIASVAERQRLVEKIGESKRSKGHQTRDFTREKFVLEKAAAEARAKGLDPNVAKDILALLIRASLTRQEQARIRTSGLGDGRSVLVIGGAGRMGRWFVEFFHSQGYVVSVADPAAVKSEVESFTDWQAAGTDYDIIVVATTLSTTAEVLSDLRALEPRGLIFDVGSLKSPLRTPLLALAEAGLQVTSIHPMFGPNTQLLAERQVVFVDVGVPDATASARALFSNTMAQCLDMSIDEHDELIAYVLGLSHLTNIAFAGALSRSDIDPKRLLAMSSPTFDAQLRMGRTVVNENPHLYYEIQQLNGLGQRARVALVDSIRSLVAAIDEGDEQEFVNAMRSSRRFISE